MGKIEENKGENATEAIKPEQALEPEPGNESSVEDTKIEENKDDDVEDDPNSVNSMAKWGKWKFYDGGADIRTKEDYCAKYPNRDIPGNDFPENAWQTDAVYANHFINEALNLVQRVQEARLAEYRHDKKEGMTPAELVERRKMFQLTYLDIEKGDVPPGGRFGPTNA